MCLPWALLLVGAPGSCAGRWRMELYGWAPVCSPLRSPVNTVPGSQAESLRDPVSCLWWFSNLRQPPSTHIPTTLCTDLHQGRRRLSIWKSSIHTGTEQSTSGILLTHCQPILICDRVRTTGHNVPTNMLLPRGRTSSQVPLHCTWWWGHLLLPRKGSSGGKACCGQL